jgi:oligopeptide transport system permease protein
VFPHVFGTDRYGRDIMVRTMFATRVSMIIGLTAALIVLVIGALLRRYGGCGHAAHRGRYLLPA